MAGAVAVRLDNLRRRAGIKATDVADLLNTTPETVSRWRAGRVEPRPEHRDHLLKLEWLVGELSELYERDQAHLWLFSPHKLLNGERPVDLIRQNRTEEVLDLIAQLKDGAYV